jgi:hypothetical protein
LTPAESTYRILDHGGFIAHFTVELVYDENAAGDGHDLVGIGVRCHQCGEREDAFSGWDLFDSLKAHARTHTPEIGAERDLDV